MKARNREIPNTGTLVSIYVLLLILTPIFKTRFGVPFRFDDVFLLFLAVRMLFDRLPCLCFPSTVLLCFSFSTFLGIVSAWSAGSRLSFSGVNDIFVALRLVLVVLVVQCHVRSEEDIGHVLRWLYTAICLSAVVAGLQYFRVSPFDVFLTSLYTCDEGYLEAMLYGVAGEAGFRMVSVYGNPNYAGLFFVIGAMFSLHMIAQRLGRLAIHGTMFVVYVILCAVALSSRTSLVLFVACSGCYGAAYLYVNKHMFAENIRLCIKIACVLVLLSFVCSLLSVDIVAGRISEFLDSSGSWAGLRDATETSRGEVWDRAIMECHRKGMWIIGNGPPDFVLDSEYLYILYSQGLFGLCLIFLMCLWPFLTFRKLRSWSLRNTALYILTLFLAFAIFGVVAPVFFNAKTGPLVAVLLGIWQVMLDDSK